MAFFGLQQSEKPKKVNSEHGLQPVIIVTIIERNRPCFS